jgi:hypothetical protein
MSVIASFLKIAQLNTPDILQAAGPMRTTWMVRVGIDSTQLLQNECAHYIFFSDDCGAGAMH